MNLTIKRLNAKRTYYFDRVKRIKKGMNDHPSEDWSESMINERLKELSDLNTKLTSIFIEIICESGDANQDAEVNEAMQEKIISLKVKLSDRLKALSEAKSNQANNALNSKEPLRIEVQQTDLYGNIPNVWGKFTGELGSRNA